MILRLRFLLIFFILLNSVCNGYSQLFQDETCACKDYSFISKSFYKNDYKIYAFLDSCNYNPETSDIKFRVPVKFWIYRKSNGKDGLTEAKIKEHINYLNHYHTINNTGISFYLRPDIEYIDKDRLFKLKYITQAPFQTAIRKSKGCINVHVVEKLKMNQRTNSAINYSGTYNSFTKGVIVAKGVSSSTLTHEIGHYFGLKHPHKYWRSKLKGEPVSRTKLISGTNIKMCEKKGDGLCDTPAEPNLSRYTDDNCKYTGWNVTDKYGEVYVPATDNIMSYTKNRECRNQFTQEQVALMLYTASENKYAKNWAVNENDSNLYKFDYFEPDNTQETAGELFFRTQQTHTFHKIYSKEKKLDFEDTVDWLYFNYETSKPKSLKLTLSKSDFDFPEIQITVFKNYEIISDTVILAIKDSKDVILQDINRGCYFIRIVKNSSEKKLTEYKIKLGE